MRHLLTESLLGSSYLLCVVNSQRLRVIDPSPDWVIRYGVSVPSCGNGDDNHSILGACEDPIKYICFK